MFKNLQFLIFVLVLGSSPYVGADTIHRLYDFEAGEPMVSQEVDDEFNQIIQMISGISVNKFLWVKNTSSDEAVAAFDQLGSGPIAVFERNGTNKIIISNNGQIGSSVSTGTAPFNISSTTKVTNLNCDLLDGLDSSELTGGGGGSGEVSNGDKGDIVVSGSGDVWTIDTDVVDNSKLANMPESTVRGRAAGAGTGDPQDLTATQATAIFNVFNSSLKGLAPASGGGTTNFLRADGSWAAPAGGGGGSSLSVEEVDGTPAVSSVTELHFDQSDGFAVTDSGGGIARVDFTAGANLTVAEADAAPTVTPVTHIQFDQADGFAVTDSGGGIARVDLSGVGGGGGTCNWTYVILSSDFSTTSGPAVDVTGLSFSPAVNLHYIIEGRFYLQSATSTVGVKPGIKWPSAGILDNIGKMQVADTAAGNMISRYWAGTVQQEPNVGDVPSANQSTWGEMGAAMRTGPSITGDFQITVRAETAGTTVKLMTGSFIRYKTIVNGLEDCD